MAVGRRLRKVLWAGALILVALAVGALIFRDEISLRYHKNRLVAAKARHWRLTTKGYSAWDHVREVLRGRPVSADEVVAVWKRHEDALVGRGFLRREMYVSRSGVLPSRSVNPQYNQLLARMEASCPWLSVARVGTNLVVTGCATGLADWKRQAGEADLRLQNEPLDGGRKVKKGCWRKRRNSRQRETFIMSLSSGRDIDDDLVRARILLERRLLTPSQEPEP